MATEEQVQQAILHYCEVKGLVAWQTSVRYKRTPCVSCGAPSRPTGGYGATKGVPDILVRKKEWPAGVMMGVEVKGPRTRLSIEQRAFVEAGQYHVVRSLDEFIAILEGKRDTKKDDEGGKKPSAKEQMRSQSKPTPKRDTEKPAPFPGNVNQSVGYSDTKRQVKPNSSKTNVIEKEDISFPLGQTGRSITWEKTYVGGGNSRGEGANGELLEGKKGARPMLGGREEQSVPQDVPQDVPRKPFKFLGVEVKAPMQEDLFEDEADIAPFQATTLIASVKENHAVWPSLGEGVSKVYPRRLGATTVDHDPVNIGKCLRRGLVKSLGKEATMMMVANAVKGLVGDIKLLREKVESDEAKIGPQARQYIPKLLNFVSTYDYAYAVKSGTGDQRCRTSHENSARYSPF